MPSAIRFLTKVALVCLAVYVTMYALATLVEPRQHEMVVTVDVKPAVLHPSGEASAGGARTNNAELDGARHARLVTLFENMPLVR